MSAPHYTLTSSSDGSVRTSSCGVQEQGARHPRLHTTQKIGPCRRSRVRVCAPTECAGFSSFFPAPGPALHGPHFYTDSACPPHSSRASTLHMPSHSVARWEGSGPVHMDVVTSSCTTPRQCQRLALVCPLPTPCPIPAPAPTPAPDHAPRGAHCTHRTGRTRTRRRSKQWEEGEGEQWGRRAQ
jgi:hypothetical protein